MTGVHAEGVRNDDGGDYSQTGHQLLGRGLDTAPLFPSRSGVCGDGDCWRYLGRLSVTWGRLVFQPAGTRY